MQGDDLLRERMRCHAYDDELPADRRHVSDTLIQRSLPKNAEILTAARSHRVPIVDVAAQGALEALADEFCERASRSIA